MSGERKSRPVSLREPRVEHAGKGSTQCYLYKDQGAYHPGDTVRFKAVVFEGDPARSFAVCKGRSVEVRLLDSEGNRLNSQKLTTNAFGAVSGRFVLPKGLPPAPSSSVPRVSACSVSSTCSMAATPSSRSPSSAR